MLVFLSFLCGLFIGFFYLKHVIKKQGAGQLKTCQSCRHKQFYDSIDLDEFLTWQRDSKKGGNLNANEK